MLRVGESSVKTTSEKKHTNLQLVDFFHAIIKTVRITNSLKICGLNKKQPPAL